MVRFSRVWRAVVRMGHPQVIRFRQRMRDDEGNTLQSQDYREGLRTLPLNAMECENIGSQTVHCLFQVADILKQHYGIKRIVKEHTTTKPESPLPEEATLSLSKPEMEAMAHSLRQE